jgi:hypothetical protein
MKTYSVAVPLFATTVMKIKAASKQQALEKARERADTPSVCHECSRHIECGEVDFDNLTIDCVEEV